MYLSITAAQPRRFVFPFRSRTIGTDRVHVADEDVRMLVVVHNRVISKRDKPQICRSYTCSCGNSVLLVRESGLGVEWSFTCPGGSSQKSLVRESGLGLEWSFTRPGGSNQVSLVREPGLGVVLTFTCPRGSSCVPLVCEPGVGLVWSFTCPRGSSSVP